MALTVVLIGIDGALAKSVYNALTASAFKLNVGQIKVITGSQPTQPLPQVEYIIGDVFEEKEAFTLAQKVRPVDIVIALATADPNEYKGAGSVLRSVKHKLYIRPDSSDAEVTEALLLGSVKWPLGHL